MGKKYSRYQASISGPPSCCRKWAFEVQDSRIAAYRIETSGFLGKKTEYVFEESTPLVAGMTVRTWDTDSYGNGNCEIRSPTGAQVADFCIYEEVEDFAADVREAIGAQT